MTHTKRVFIFGAGFSRAAGMPLATELLDLLCEKLDHGESEDDDDDMPGWLDSLRQRLAWLSGCSPQKTQYNLNIEEIFHYANFDIEVHRLRQQLSPVGRGDGPGTSWNVAEHVSAWLQHLEDALRDVILETDTKADLTPIVRWAHCVGPDDAVMTFNYDTLVERALAEVGKGWNHAMPGEDHHGTAVCKLHGSIDWIVAHRRIDLRDKALLFDKRNENRSDRDTGSIEDDYRLWRCRTREQLQNWVSGRDLQYVPTGAMAKIVGIAGLGTYKQLHVIPGLAVSWTQGMRKLYEADLGIVVGFSMSDFDTMARMQFAEVARKRHEDGRPLRIVVIDPNADEQVRRRFEQVFRTVEFLPKCHQDIDWDGVSHEGRDDSVG